MAPRETQKHITRAGNLLGLVVIVIIAGCYPAFEYFDFVNALLGLGFLAVSFVIIGLVATRMLPSRKDRQNAGN